ncbi:MAG: transcriptional regulator FilR1 domain-containing protein, partial [Candidatus Methanofastidiosia archaeon]
AVEESINLFKMAEEFVWAMSSEVMEEPGEILNLKLQENPIFGWRRIFLREIIENPENERVLDKIHTTVLINEKMAILFLPYLHGKTDFSKAFVSDDEKFYNWCRDLFLYYWKKAKI